MWVSWPPREGVSKAEEGAHHRVNKSVDKAPVSGILQQEGWERHDIQRTGKEVAKDTTPLLGWGQVSWGPS